MYNLKLVEYSTEFTVIVLMGTLGHLSPFHGLKDYLAWPVFSCQFENFTSYLSSIILYICELKI